MIKRTFIFLVLFVITGVLYFLFDEDISGYFLILEAVYFLGAFLFCLIEKTKLKIRLRDNQFSVEREQDIPIQVQVENKSRIIDQRVRLYFKLENKAAGNKKRFYRDYVIPKKSKQMISIPVSAKNCGAMVVTLSKARIYDLCYLMCIHKRMKQQMKVTVLPKAHLLALEVSKKTRDFIADAEEHSDRESGDDVSEIFQVREYTEQDSVRDIHWKLSAKMDDLFVKDYGKTLGSSVLIWLNTEKGKQKKKNRKQYMQVLEMIASISLSLFEQECIHTVAWYEKEQVKVRKKRVSKERNVYELMNLLGTIETYEGNDLPVIYEDAFRGESFSTIIEISLSGEVLVNKEHCDIPRKKGMIDWKQVAFSV